MGAGITTVLSSQDCGPTFPSSLPVGEGAWRANPGVMGQLLGPLCAVGSGVLTQRQKTACSRIHQPSPWGKQCLPLCSDLWAGGASKQTRGCSAESLRCQGIGLSDARQALLCPDASGPQALTCSHRSVPFSCCFSLTSGEFWFGGDWLMGAPDTPFSTAWVDRAFTDQGLAFHCE